MTAWINTHGLILLIVMYGFSLATSVMPQIPTGKGFWTTWSWNVLQVFGANAGNLVKHSPMGSKFESLVSDSKKTSSDGSAEVSHTVASSLPVDAALVPKT
jgi:hypothetical protein